MKYFLSNFRWYRRWKWGCWRYVSGGRGLSGGPWEYWINRQPVLTGYCGFERVLIEEHYDNRGKLVFEYFR